MPFAFTLDIKEHYGLDEKKDCHFGESIIIQVELLSIVRNQDLSYVVHCSNVISSQHVNSRIEVLLDN